MPPALRVSALIAAGIATVLLVSGCARFNPLKTPRRAKPGVLFGPSRQLSAADYDNVRQTWTASSRIYEGLETMAFITATFHAPDFRRAFALSFPDIYGHGGDITKRELVDLTGDVEQYLTFFVAMYTPDNAWNDLAQEDSIWRLTLVGSDGVSVGPEEIAQIKIDEKIRAVYPYLDRFHKAYLVRFPLLDRRLPDSKLLLTPHSTGFSLRVASALGHAILKWPLVPAAKSSR